MTARRIFGRTYSRAALLALGGALLLLALAGALDAALGGLTLAAAALWTHGGAGAAMLAIGLVVRDDAVVNVAAAALAATFAGLGLLGFLASSIGPATFTTHDNILHLGIGAVGLGAWAASRETRGDESGRPTM